MVLRLDLDVGVYVGTLGFWFGGIGSVSFALDDCCHDLRKEGENQKEGLSDQ